VAKGWVFMLATIPCVWLLLSGVAESGSALEVLERMVAESPDRVVSTAYIAFNAKRVGPSPSAESLDKMVELVADALKSQISKLEGQPEVRERYEKALASNRQNVEREMLANAEQEIAGVFKAYGPSVGGDRLLEVRYKRRNSDWSQGTSLLTRKVDNNVWESVFHDADSKLASVSRDNISLGVEYPHGFGRIDDLLIAFLNDRISTNFQCEFDDNESMSAGEKCIVWSANQAEKKYSGKVIFDEGKGFVCRLSEYKSEPQGVFGRMECEGFFIAGAKKSESIWFPAKCKIIEKIQDGNRTTEYRFEEAGVKLNLMMSPDVFSITIPANSSLDYKFDAQASFRTFCDVEVKLDEIRGLANHKCVTKSSKDAAASRRSSPGTVVALVSVFGFFILLLLLYHRQRAV